MNEDLKNLINAMRKVVISPAFILLTLLGNGLIIFCSYLFYILEKDINPKVNTIMDGIWWAFATATTTGYGDITPLTTQAKLLSIFLMLSGLAFFAMYTALFAETILTLKRKNA